MANVDSGKVMEGVQKFWEEGGVNLLLDAWHGKDKPSKRPHLADRMEEALKLRNIAIRELREEEAQAAQENYWHSKDPHQWKELMEYLEKNKTPKPDYDGKRERIDFLKDEELAINPNSYSETMKKHSVNLVRLHNDPSDRETTSQKSKSEQRMLSDTQVPETYQPQQAKFTPNPPNRGGWTDENGNLLPLPGELQEPDSMQRRSSQNHGEAPSNADIENQPQSVLPGNGGFASHTGEYPEHFPPTASYAASRSPISRVDSRNPDRQKRPKRRSTAHLQVPSYEPPADLSDTGEEWLTDLESSGDDDHLSQRSHRSRASDRGT